MEIKEAKHDQGNFKCQYCGKGLPNYDAHRMHEKRCEARARKESAERQEIELLPEIVPDGENQGNYKSP